MTFVVLELIKLHILYSFPVLEVKNFSIGHIVTMNTLSTLVIASGWAWEPSHTLLGSCMLCITESA